MSSITAHHVADYLLAFAREHGDCLTNLKLQKLLYYSQAWYLALYGKPIFDDAFEAWVHGPVVRSVYRRFNRYRFNPITGSVDKPDLPRRVRSLIEEVFSKYGCFTGWDLERLTHEEVPWLAARDGLPPEAISSAEIDIGVMKSYYKSRLDGST